MRTSFLLIFIFGLPFAVQAQNSDVSSSLSPEVTAAEAAIAQSDWKIAEAHLDPWIASHPLDGHALFDAGYVADAQSRTADAEGFYRRAIHADPKSFEAHISLGLLLARESKFTEAQTELATATQLDTGSVPPEFKARAWRALARIAAQSDPAKASDDLLEALKITPETEEDTLLAANLADMSGQFDTAEAAYKRVLAKNTNSVAAKAGLVHLLIARKKYAEAETFLRDALRQSPNDPALTAQLATVLAAQDKAEALPLLEQLHDAHVGDAAITRMLATVYADAGEYAASDKLLAELLTKSPEDAGLLISHGQNLIYLQRNQEALNAFDKATRLASSNADAWSGLAFASSKANQPSVTIHALTMRAQYAADIPSTYFLWATSYDALHQRADAVIYYRKFLESAAGKFPNQEWQARQRLKILGAK